MSTRNETWMWLAQRISAAVLGLCVCVHLITIIVAVQNGLSADEITTRLSGAVGWLSFYLVFVVAAAIHAPLGIRTVLAEWTPLGQYSRAILCIVFAATLLWLGARAAFAMYAG